MIKLYSLLLRLYPKHVQEEFGAEMLSVFQAAAHDGGGLGFLLRECGGLVRGAARERQTSPRWISAFGGVAAAFAIYWGAYSLLVGVVARIGTNIHRSAAREDPLVVAVMALGALMMIVPLVVMACRETQRNFDSRRFYHKRLRAHR